MTPPSQCLSPKLSIQWGKILKYGVPRLASPALSLGSLCTFTKYGRGLASPFWSNPGSLLLANILEAKDEKPLFEDISRKEATNVTDKIAIIKVDKNETFILTGYFSEA